MTDIHKALGAPFMKEGLFKTEKWTMAIKFKVVLLIFLVVVMIWMMACLVLEWYWWSVYTVSVVILVMLAFIKYFDYSPCCGLPCYFYCWTVTCI